MKTDFEGSISIEFTDGKARYDIYVPEGDAEVQLGVSDLSFKVIGEDNEDDDGEITTDREFARLHVQGEDIDDNEPVYLSMHIDAEHFIELAQHVAEEMDSFWDSAGMAESGRGDLAANHDEHLYGDKRGTSGPEPASQWEPITVEPFTAVRYRVLFQNRNTGDIDVREVETTMDREERDQQTSNNKLWETIHIEAVNPAAGRYDVVECHIHTAEPRVYRIGGWP